MVRLRSPAPVLATFLTGVFPSGQRGQTVNLLSLTSLVRIQPLPPQKKDTKTVSFFCGESVVFGPPFCFQRKQKSGSLFCHTSRSLLASGDEGKSLGSAENPAFKVDVPMELGEPFKKQSIIDTKKVSFFVCGGSGIFGQIFCFAKIWFVLLLQSRCQLASIRLGAKLTLVRIQPLRLTHSWNWESLLKNKVSLTPKRCPFLFVV